MRAGAAITRKRHWNFVIARHLAGFSFANAHLDGWRQAEGAPNLLFDPAIYRRVFVRGLSRLRRAAERA